MSHRPAPKSAARPPLSDLVATLEAMRDAGWVTIAPVPTPVEVTGLDTPVAELPGGHR